MTAQRQLAEQAAEALTAAAHAAERPTTVIRPSTRLAPLDLGELWAFRELLYFFTWRDIKVRYKQTVLGGAWAVIQPLFTMIVFSIFFGRLAGISSDGVPYPLFAYCALVPWTYFANALSQASTSLVNQERLVTKVYFPRLLVPMAPVAAGLLDFALAFGVLVGLQLYYGVAPGLAILSLPFFILLAAATAFGVGLWLSALNVRYRDVRFAVPFFIQLWLFATPIAYPSSLVPERWKPIYGLNPMAGVVDGFRWALLGQGEGPSMLTLVSGLAVVALLVSGLYYFRRAEQSFADVV